MKKDFNQTKIQNEEFELLRSGISDQGNLLVEDELSELFGGSRCKPDCPADYVSCPRDYCGDYDDEDDNGDGIND